MPNPYRSRLHEIGAEMDKIANNPQPDAAAEQRFGALETEFQAVHRLDLLARANEHGAIEAGCQSPDTRSTGQAHRVIEKAVRSGTLIDGAAERATLLIERGNPRDRSVASQWVATAGNPAYLTAFSKLAADPERGHLRWDESERIAFDAVEEFRASALSPDSAGGFMVPFVLDPAIMLTSAGSISELRQVARVVTTTSDSWNGVSSAGVTAKWHAEAEEATDDAPTLAQPSIPVHRGDAFVPFSFEVGMDAPNFAAEMGRLLADAADQLQTTAYTVGTGTGQPEGLITGLAGGPSVVNAATAETFGSTDVYNVQAALAPRFQANAMWMGNVATLNKIAAFESTAGARLFPEVGTVPAALLRKPLHELSTLDGTINPAATEANHVLVYGDFAAGFVIVDRIGTTVELIPHLFGANRRPTGQRGFLMWFRTGSKVVVPNAFRVLNVATTV